MKMDVVGGFLLIRFCRTSKCASCSTSRFISFSKSISAWREGYWVNPWALDRALIRIVRSLGTTRGWMKWHQGRFSLFGIFSSIHSQCRRRIPDLLVLNKFIHPFFIGEQSRIPYLIHGWWFCFFGHGCLFCLSDFYLGILVPLLPLRG